MLFEDMTAKRPKVTQSGLLRLLKIRKHGPRRDDCRIVVTKTESTRRAGLPLSLKLFSGMVNCEMPTGPRRDRLDAD